VNAELWLHDCLHYFLMMVPHQHHTNELRGDCGNDHEATMNYRSSAKSYTVRYEVNQFPSFLPQDYNLCKLHLYRFRLVVVTSYIIS